MNSLKNKVALITGSARGLGKAIAERYASLGANIIINYSKDRDSAIWPRIPSKTILIKLLIFRQLGLIVIMRNIHLNNYGKRGILN